MMTLWTYRGAAAQSTRSHTTSPAQIVIFIVIVIVLIIIVVVVIVFVVIRAVFILSIKRSLPS